jgi:hypothetical protein
MHCVTWPISRQTVEVIGRISLPDNSHYRQLTKSHFHDAEITGAIVANPSKV